MKLDTFRETKRNPVLHTTRWQLMLLLVWMAIGIVLRFTQLTNKSPWTDEFATMVFSLGNSFQTVPLDKVIGLDVLMQPLEINPAAGTSAVIHHLLTEDVHPPLYFVLVHWWLKLFPPVGGLVSLWGERSLPALFGVASIPAAYGLATLAWRSPIVGQMAAAMMAVSPYSIFLSQEARQYSLAALWVIASLCCLVIATRHINLRTSLPMGVALGWVVINSLGIATHYFFVLTLCAEAMVLIVFAGLQIRKKRHIHPQIFSTYSSWWRIYATAAGTLTGGFVWVLVWQNNYNSKLTEWIKSDPGNILHWLNPVFQSVATWLTMISLLPVESSTLVVVIASGLGMLIFFLWALPILKEGIVTQWQQPGNRLATAVLGGFVLGAIAQFYIFSYALGIDLTRGARYSFVYFPAVIVLVGASLAIFWRQDSGDIKGFSVTSGKKIVALIWLMGLVSGVIVVSNLGYRKYYRPEILVPAMQQTSSVPVLIATTHNTIVQTGEMMGIAWELKRANDLLHKLNPQFLLAHQEENQCEGKECRASTILEQNLTQQPRPFDLWLINFHAPVELETQKCIADPQYFEPAYGYDYNLYHCLTDEKSG